MMGNFSLNDDTMVQTAYPEYYEEFVLNKKIFPKRYHLFVLALGLGVLKGLKSEKKPYRDTVRIRDIKDNGRETIEIIYSLAFDKGGKDDWVDLLMCADGGLELIRQEYQTQGAFDLPRLLDEAESLWPDRAKELIGGLE